MTTLELEEIKKNWESMTPLERNAVTQQMAIKIYELELELEQREAGEAEQVPLLREKINWYETEIKKGNAQIVELLQKIEALKKDEIYRDAGMQYLIDMKTEIRGLAVQVGETETEQDDAFLSKQLSFCGPDELNYLKSLKMKLETKRSGMFLLGSISPDSLDSEHEKKEQYKLGKKIGQGVIPVH